MPQSRNMFSFVGISVLLTIALSHLIVPRNPDYSLVMQPEAISVAILAYFIAFLLLICREGALPDWSIRRSELVGISFVYFVTFFMTFPRMLWSLVNTPMQKWTPCRSLVNFHQKIDCYSQAAMTHHYGLRSFTVLLCALALGTLVFVFVRVFKRAFHATLFSVWLAPFVVTLIGFFALVLKIDQVLPHEVVLNSWGKYRFTQVFGNPSWTWPYLTPGLCISLWGIVAFSKRILRLGAMASALLFSLGMLATQQRGALLLLVVVSCVWVMFYLKVRFQHKHRLYTLGVIGICFLFVLGYVWAIHSPQALKQLAELIGYTWRDEPILFSRERTEIWKAALTVFSKAPLWGHGYASWYQVIAHLAEKNWLIYIFDTAHNLYIQIFTELGVFHGMCVLLALFFIFLLSLRNACFLVHGKLLVYLCATSFFVTTFIQEVDYIRPTYYLHAILWGCIAGAPFYQKGLDVSSERETKYHLLNANNFSEKIRKKFALVFLCVGSFAMLLFLYCRVYLPQGTYPLEADISQDLDKRLLRWHERKSMIPGYGFVDMKTYSNHPFYFESPDGWYRQKVLGEEFAVHFGKKGLVSIPVLNGKRFLPYHNNIELSKDFPNETRFISALFVYPGYRSNLGIFWSKGMYDWENVAGRSVRWCGAECYFVARSCGSSERLRFEVLLSRPDVSTYQPLRFDVKVDSLNADVFESLEKAKASAVHLATFKDFFTDADGVNRISVTGNKDTKFYLVHLTTSSTFRPSALKVNSDNRELGLMVADTDCEKYLLALLKISSSVVS